jgi:molybdopterin-guanine dinucleotide biosynthesis protein
MVRAGVEKRIVQAAFNRAAFQQHGVFALRKAGASQTLVASDRRWALMTETPDERPPSGRTPG